MSSSQNWSIDASDRGIAEAAKEAVRKLKAKKEVQTRLKTIKELDRFGNVLRIIHYQ